MALTDIKPKGTLASIGAEDLRKRLLDVEKERKIAVQDYRSLPENRGGVLGGIGYVAEKIGAGFMQGIEGVWDYAAGGIADAFGNDAWAEEQVGTSWFPEWYENIDKNFNPTGGWRTAGDIGGAIGSSLPAYIPSAIVAGGAALATIGTGGTATPVTVPTAVSVITALASGATAWMSAGGQAASEAYKQTGKLTGKEWGYASLVGATEAGIELASIGIGAGTGKVVKALTKTATPATKVAARTGANKIVGGVLRAGGSLAKDFAAEAIEEGTAEIMSPLYARMTIDPNADLATIDEVAYSAFVGGISGVLFGGVGSAFTAGQNIAHSTSLGRQAVQNGTAKAITDTAKIIAEAERKRPSGYDLFQRIEKAYKAIEGTEEKDYTAKQMRKLGELEVLTSAARFLPEIEASAINAVMNAEEVAQRFAGIGVQKDGRAITAEDIYGGLVGVNPSTQDGITRIRKALSTNPTLIAVSVADATGRLMLDSSNPTGGVVAQGMSEDAYKALQGSKSAPAVATQMGLGDSLANVDYTAFTEAAKRYAQTESGRKYVKGVSEAKRVANSLMQNTDALPEKVDGTKRYGRYAFIEKDGRYRVYDYVRDVMSFEMTKEEAQAFLDRLNGKSEKAKAESAEEKKPAQAEAPAEATPAPAPVEEKKPEEKKPEEEKPTKVAEVSRKKNGVIYEGFSPDEQMTELQSGSLKAIEMLAKFAPNLNYHVYRSEVVGGKRSVVVNGEVVTSLGGVNVKYAPNGFFTQGNHIYIDLNAGNNGQGTMLFTLSHEVTHVIAAHNRPALLEIEVFLRKQYRKNSENFQEVVEKKRIELERQYKARGEAIPDGKAWEDLVNEEACADSMARLLADPKAYEMLGKLKSNNADLHTTLGDGIKRVLARLKMALKGYKAEKSSGDDIGAFAPRAYKKLLKLYTKAFVEADANAGATIGARSLEDLADAKNENGETLFQYRAMEADEDTYKAMLKKWGKMTDTQIENLFTTIDRAMDIIRDNLEILDYAWEADIDDRAFSPVKRNRDKLYKVSLDFSTLCRKRILQQTIQAHLQEALNKPISKEESIAIRDALIAIQEEGRKIEVACALCYVEAARMKAPAQIKRFMADREKVITASFAGKSSGAVKEVVAQAEADARARLGVGKTPLGRLPESVANQIREAKKGALTAYELTAEEQELIDIAKGMTTNDFTTPQGLENLAKNYPRLFDAYTSYIVNATHSKGIENDTWWRAGDSASIGDVLIANMNRENGTRSQSWSDFQVMHILDYIASTIELATRNAKMQAYTKVPDYVELMGLTGVMINLSLIPTANFNGKTLDYDSVDGMDYKVALQLRDKYHNTVGTICIGVDNVQIKLLLADTTIDYVIPYHSSSMSKATRKLMRIPAWADYEDYQTEKKLDRKQAQAQAEKYGVKLLDESGPNWHKETSFSEWFDLAEAQKIAEQENRFPSDKAKQKKYGVMYGGYMAMQNAANNYLRLCAERGISPKFSNEDADFTGEENYWKVLIDRKMVDNITGEIIEQKPIKPIFSETEVLRILNDELERYPKVKADQEYAIRTVTEKMLSGEIKGGMSAEDIAKVMKKPVDNVANVNILASADEVKFSDRDSEGNTLTAEQQEFFRDSKVRDEEGRLLVLHRGSPEDFGTVFRFLEENLNSKDQPNTFGFFFTDSHETAEYYSKARGNEGDIKTVYLNIEHPLDLTSLGISSSEKEFYLLLEENGVITGRSRYKQDYKPVWTRFDKNGESMRRSMESAGFDGVVYHDWGENKATYVAFYPEQIKLTTNTHPTSAPDIRYSDRDTADAVIDMTAPSVYHDKSTYKPTRREKAIDLADRTYAELFNAQVGVEKALRDMGMSRAEAEAEVQYVRSAGSAAQTMIDTHQVNTFGGKYDVVGKGLLDILKPTRHWSAEKKADFDLYLLHLLNEDRMSLERRTTAMMQTKIAEAQVLSESLDSLEGKERRKAEKELADLGREIKAGIIQDKPVFDVNEDIGRDHAITEAESKEAADALAEKHPEFVKLAESIHGYSRNLLQMRVDAGLITQEQMDRMQELYPHYVPSYRDIDAGYGFVPVRGKGAMAISSTVKRAKGGGQNILRISDILAGQTTEVMRAGRLNELMNLLYPDIEEDTDSTADALPDEEGDNVLLKPTNGQVTFFRNGKAVTVKTPDGITLALEDLRTPSVDTKNPIEGALAFGMKAFRGLVTSYSPTFMPKNAARDLQDAGINSKHAKGFYANLKTAVEQIAKNGEYWQEYRAMGGFSSSVFQDTLAADSGYAGFASIAGMFEKGDFTPNGLKKMFKTLGKSAKALCKGVENLNNFVEQVPRLAEYIASRKAGDSIKVAMNNSAEVTTNFGRHGRTSKKLNAILIPFLNANLQGFDKMFRNASEAVTSTQAVRSLSRLLTKAVLIGMVPMLLNMLMYDDDEEYEALRDTDKENYFLIKVSDDSFIRIPRGRVASVIGGAMRRTVKAAKGEDPDIKGYLENVSTQISPVESLSRDIFSPLRDAASNQTWYGSRIEGMEFEDTKPRDRYDESTSSIAIALGKLFNRSPKKIHYVLDQYSGVIGDLLLPATSGKENKGLFSGNLTVDSVLSARWTTDFYDLYEKTNYKKTEGDEEAAYVIRYLNRVKKSVKALNDEIDAIRAGDGSNVDKIKEVRVIRALINAEYKAALDSVENVRAAVAVTDGIENETLRDAEVTRIVFGAESALKNYDGNVYAKYAPLAEAGVSFDDIYDFYFSSLLIESDRDSTGEVVQGSKKRKVLDLLREMDIPVKHKILLAEAKGYKVSASDIGN